MEITDFNLSSFKKKLISETSWPLILIVNVCLLIFFLATINGCSNKSDSNQSGTTAGKNRVVLTTGDGNNQIFWTIDEVARTDNYLKTDLSYVLGDSLLIQGGAKTESSSGPFLQDGLPAFILEDENGQQFTMEAVVADKNVAADGVGTLVTFQVYFLLSSDGSFNQSIKTGKNLIISDPLPANRGMAGHSTDLSSFIVSK